ncbi:Scr1 family TA system antitoxin-like transcriptional regulator [Streptomyces sp. NPDC005576]|uniref:Scr1 family TA system antitoxin-like transcriptional regulator n=1 Tax=unclassified Streptomyces TaxID=2593676 RepID=UPI0033E098EB
MSVVDVESLTSALYVEERRDVAVYQDAAGQLRAAALSPGDSADLIRETGAKTRWPPSPMHPAFP